MKIGRHGSFFIASDRSEGISAGIVRKPLGNKYRGSGIVCARIGRNHPSGIIYGNISRQGGFYLHIFGFAIIHKTRVETTKIEVPGFFGIGSFGAAIGNVSGAQVASFEVFGHGYEIFCGSYHRPVAGIFGPSVGIEAVVGFGVERPQPVDKLRMPPVAVGIDPGSVFHMYDIISGNGMITQKLLNGGGFITRSSSCVRKARH